MLRRSHNALAKFISSVTIVMFGLLIRAPGDSAAFAASEATYYVDCSAGSDFNSGMSENRAWQTLDRANAAMLFPGDTLLLKRNCIWQGSLWARWDGTADRPIVISAYGADTTDNQPKIENSDNATVKITGSYQIIEHLRTAHDPSSFDRVASCGNQPVGWRIGFNFMDDAHHNTLRYSRAALSSIGINFSDASHDNKVLYNRIVENYGMWDMDRGLGGTGINLHGDANEVAYNSFKNNRSLCKQGTVWLASIAIELYNATNANVHHNNVDGDRVFVELGSSTTIQSADNVFAYNTHVTDLDQSRFVVTRGQPHPYGPVWRTKLFNNAIYYTGSGSQGVICQLCSPEVLTMRNNIIVVRDKALYVGQGESLTESNNIFWRPGGLPLPRHFIQNVILDVSSAIVNPQLVDPGAGNFHSGIASPAVNAGSLASVNNGYETDIDGQIVPSGGVVDIGVDELP